VKISKVVILHGTDGTPEGIWIPWLKSALEKKGVSVWAPLLPGNSRPDIKKYNDYILNNRPWKFDETTLIVGHSSGSVETLGLLEELPPVEKIKQAILVATFEGDLGWPELSSLNIQFDFNKIKKQSYQFVVIHSDDDPYCPLEGAKSISKKLNAEFVLIKNKQHFSGDMDEFPELLKIIEREEK